MVPPAQRRLDAQVTRRGRGGLIAAAIAAAVIAAVAGSLYALRLLARDYVSIHGYIALAIGVVGVCGLAGGLMALAFYSSRAGWDDIERDE